MESVAECPGGSPVFLQLINTLLIAQCVRDPARDYQPNYSANLRGEVFDFVIVGGGTAGSVLARRLSEDPNTKVLLVEAGGYPTSDSEIPALWSSVIRGPGTYQYLIEPSDYACKGFKNGKCPYQRGKMLGGSSSLSVHLYLRGNAQNYNEWESLGNPGWNWSEALRYFKKSEDCKSEKYHNGLHGIGGPLKTSYSRAATNYRELYFKAAEEAGYAIRDDESLEGFFEVLATYNQGKAESAAGAYLKPIKTRDNLKVALNSTATKIVIENRKAIGVEVDVDGVGFLVKASKEVIVSAGVINSPQLLMLSGIGPKEDLEKFRIEVVADLPVGRNFQDHVQFYGLWFAMNTSLDPISTDKDDLNTFYEYCVNNTGPLSQLDTFNILRYFSTKDEKYPNIQTWYMHSTKGDGKHTRNFLNDLSVNEDTINSILEALKEHDLVNIGPTLLTPKSRGSVKLRSSNPRDSPLINAGYLKDFDDIQSLIGGIRDALHFVAQPSMQKRGAKLLRLEIPDCETLEDGSDDYWECALRNLASTAFDGSGTCVMGPDGVVDETLGVRGVEGLRVIDASVMPKIPAANLDAPVIMLAEKGADLIKEAWNM